MLSVVCKFVPASYRSDTILQSTLNVLKVTAECGGLRMDFMLVGLFGLMNRPNESEMDTLIDAPIQMSCCSLTYKVFVNTHFYRAMLCIRGTSHGPVSVSVCLSQVGVLLKRLNVGSHKQHHTIAPGL